MNCYIKRYSPPLSLFKTPLKLLSALFISVHLSSASAAVIPEFHSSYFVQAFGGTLGKAKQSFQCKGEDCTLISSAKPSGFAALFIKDSSVEFIKLKQNDESLKWLNYHKIGISEKDGRNIEKHVHLKLDEKNQQIVYPEKERTWPVQQNIFDVMSLPFALQYYKLNQQDFKTLELHIQDNSFQEQLTLSRIEESDSIDFEFSFEEVDALKYTLDSQNYQIQVWLLPNKHYFPGKIRVINKDEDKTITLTLAEQPKLL